MIQQNKSFEELLTSLSLISTMDSGEGVLEAIAEFYDLGEYKDYFSMMRQKALDNEFFLTEDDIQEIISKQKEMMEKIILIDSEQADQIDEALQNL